MMTTIKVKVTQKDIDNGIRSSAYSCPVALAIKRELERDDIIVLTRFLIDVETRATLSFNRFLLIKFIKDFDAGRPVAPNEFEIDLLNE